jgi:hypothetical protein
MKTIILLVTQLLLFSVWMLQKNGCGENKNISTSIIGTGNAKDYCGNESKGMTYPPGNGNI